MRNKKFNLTILGVLLVCLGIISNNLNSIPLTNDIGYNNNETNPKSAGTWEEWEAYLNLSTSDWVHGITNDSSDNSYIVGSLSSSNQIFLAKYNRSGQQQWFKTWRRFLRQRAYDLTIDSGGNIYVIGDAFGGSKFL